MELVRMGLDRLRANELNPRTSFSDIDGLADSFELNPVNPGEPLTPIIAVRDANVARIIDGERRYRAMRKRGKVDSCAVLLCDDMDDADAALAMLATNERSNLTQVEVSRGLQQALLLGVPEETIDRAARRPVAKAIRRMQGRNGGKIEQVSLDRMLAAEKYADSDEDYRTVMESEEWEYEARRIDRRRKTEAQREAEKEAVAKAEAAGVAIVERRPKGAVLERTICRDGLPDAVEEGAAEWAAEGFVLVRPKSDWSGWELFSPNPDPEEDEAARETKNGLRRANSAGRARRLEWAARRLSDSGVIHLRNVSLAVAAWVAENESGKAEGMLGKAGIDISNLSITANSWMVATFWQDIDWMTNADVEALADGSYGRWNRPAYERHLAIVRAMAADGYEPEEDEAALTALVKEADAALAAKEAEHDG